VRGALDTVMVAAALAELRGRRPTDPQVGLDAAMAALSGRIRIHEGSGRTAEQIVTDLWEQVFGRARDGGWSEQAPEDGEAEEEAEGGAEGSGGGKAKAPPA